MKGSVLSTEFRRRFCRTGKTARGAAASPAKRRPRALALVLGAAAAALAGWMATRGLSWSDNFHPDERPIRQWLEQALDEGYVKERAYPGGWFELYRIPAWFGKQSDKWRQRWEEHYIQTGRVAALDESTFTRFPVTEKRVPRIQEGRNFNAWLYVLACVFLYAACLEAGFHPAGAFVSALFFLGSAPPVEFARYCETDGAVSAALAFCAWLAARSLRKGAVWLTVATGFAAGFAVACKFTLFPVLLWCLAGPAAAVWRGGGSVPRRWGRWGGLALGCLAAALAGYAVGTPALWHDPKWYFGAMQFASRRTFAEIRINLGGHYTRMAAATLRAGCLAREFGAWGWLPLGWGVFAWAFWFRGRFRRQLAGAPGLLPVFVPFLLFCCPFVRRQEMLPFAVLFAFGAGLPFEWLAERGRGWGGKRAAAAVAVAAAGALALGGGMARALGMASCFAERDTRAEAQNWLHGALPAGTAVGFDAYVEQVARGVDCRAVYMKSLPFRWEGAPDEDAPYYVENVGFEGRRAVRDTRTSRLLPEARRRVADYEASVLPLRTWAVATGTPKPTFGQPTVRLVAFGRPAGDACRVPIGYGRPVAVLPSGAPLYDAAGVGGLGANRAVRTVGKRTVVHVKLEDGPRWLVTRMLEGDEGVKIAREGLFEPEKSDLRPGGAVAAALRPGWRERLAARAAAYSTAKCRMRGDDQRIVCATFVAGSAAEAARELRLGGDPAGALALLREAGAEDGESRVEAFLAAAAAGEKPERAWTEAARAALAAWDRFAAERESMGRMGAVFCGVPVDILEDFARTRTGWLTLKAGLRLPVYLPPGRYTVAVSIREETPETLVPARLFKEQTEDFRTNGESPERRLWKTGIDIRHGQMPRVAGTDGEDWFEPFEGEVEFAWSPVERTRETAEALRRALRAFPPP